VLASTLYLDPAVTLTPASRTRVATVVRSDLGTRTTRQCRGDLAPGQIAKLGVKPRDLPPFRGEFSHRCHMAS
jgi:hypothetical protein